METKRQKRIAKIIQQDLAEILQGEIRRAGVKNFLVSVTKTYVTPDLTLARVYVSIFPPEKADESVAALRQNAKLIKHAVAQRVRHQLRKMPDLEFYRDDTLDYIERIDEALGNKPPRKNESGEKNDEAS
ncbi:MAG: 30S ribosome-binding factor RbfA [Chlorobi bacterium]|nr:30S ribosome-binding factor RbfA [Chlorobiota bacterium]